MTVYGYSFEGNYYADTEAGRLELLQEVSEAITTAVYSDPEMEHATDDERQEAESMTWDGTSRDMLFWDNCIAIMQHCPYTLDIKRIDDSSLDADISACCEWLDIPNTVDATYIKAQGLTEVESSAFPVVLSDRNGNEFYGGSLRDAVQEHMDWVAEGRPEL
jgi:hypothetical protein